MSKKGNVVVVVIVVVVVVAILRYLGLCREANVVLLIFVVIQLIVCLKHSFQIPHVRLRYEKLDAGEVWTQYKIKWVGHEGSRHYLLISWFVSLYAIWKWIVHEIPLDRVLLFGWPRYFEEFPAGCYQWQISYDRPVIWSGGFSFPRLLLPEYQGNNIGQVYHSIADMFKKILHFAWLTSANPFWDYEAFVKESLISRKQMHFKWGSFIYSSVALGWPKIYTGTHNTGCSHTKIEYRYNLNCFTLLRFIFDVRKYGVITTQCRPRLL